jgi:hypothetical protein
MAREHSGKLSRPAIIPRGSGRALGTRHEHHRPASGRQRVGQGLRTGAQLIQADWHGGHPQCAQQVKERRVTRILHRDPVTRPQPRPDHALHPVQRSPDDGKAGRIDPVRPEPGRCQFRQLGRHRRVAVQAGRHSSRPPHSQGGERRQQCRVWRSGGQVPDPGRDDQRRSRRCRRRPGDPRPGSPVPARDPLDPQIAVRRRDGCRAEPQFRSQGADRRQRRARLQPAVADSGLDVGSQLARTGTRWAIMYWHNNLMYCNKL